MTKNDETAEALRVEQVDRDAAVEIIGTFISEAAIHGVRRGKDDGNRYVQAFAHHRLAALSDRATDREGGCKGCNGLGYNIMAPQTTWQGGERVPCVVCKGHPPIFTASFPACQPIADPQAGGKGGAE